MVISNREKQTTYRILLLEKDAYEVKFMSSLIQSVVDCRIEVVNCDRDFLDLLNKNNYHLAIVTDLVFGLFFLERIKRIDFSGGIIFISDQPKIEDAVTVMRLGAEDYLGRPFKGGLFQLAVKRALEKKFALNRPDDGAQGLAFVDDATGLYNNRYLKFTLDREIRQSYLSKESFSVLFIDADRFKEVNDVYGHSIGTKLLKELGHHFKKFLREGDSVFRYGGDEFVAVLSPCDLMTGGVVAERIRESVEKKIFLINEGFSIRMTVSIGVALFPDHSKNKKELIDAADQAMYRVKKTTRNGVFIAKPMSSTLSSPMPNKIAIPYQSIKSEIQSGA